MKPILITLMFVPLIVLLVGLVHTWWHRPSLSPAAKYRVMVSIFCANLALLPVFVWFCEPWRDYWVFGMVCMVWVSGLMSVKRELRVLRKMRDEQRFE